MAFYNPQDDEDGDTVDAQSGGVQIGPQSSTLSDAPGAASGPNAPGAPDKGGNFVGITKYLEANKPQAAKLGDQAAGVINTSADQARQGVASLQSEAQNKIKPVSSLDESLSSKIANGAETLTGDERNTVKSTANAQYKGPNDVAGLGDAYTNAVKAQKVAQTNIDNSGTEQGRMGLISQINNKPRTQGMNVFDNALLQAGGGREKLAQSAAANQDIKGGLDAASEQIRNQIGRADDPSTPDVDESAGAIGQTNKAQADAYKKVQDAMSAWRSGFDPKVSAAQDAFTAKQNALTEDLGNQDLFSQDTMGLYGLGEGERFYGLDLNSYLNPATVSDINAGNIASAQDYARYSALADLAGDTSGYLNPANASQAGTAPMPGIDRARFDMDKNKAAADYATAWTKQKLNAAGFDGTPQQAQALLSGEGGNDPMWQPLAQALNQWKDEHYSNRVARTNPNSPVVGDPGPILEGDPWGTIGKSPFNPEPDDTMAPVKKKGKY